jgi:D-3-phosphoglycerate dehydrogenase / 2-oxoglutarate reductase
VSELVVITDSSLETDGIEERLLAGAGLRCHRASASSEDEVIASAAGADALIVQWAPITARVLDALPEVRLISRLGIGYDMIDVDAASARGVAVANTPDYCVEEVAAHAVALLLALARGVLAFDRAVRAGGWNAPAAYPQACRPSEQAVAVIGLGRIGARVAPALRALGFQVLGVDPQRSASQAQELGAELVSLDEALERADHVTLHLPLTAATTHLIDGPALARMRPTATMVNTCRGGLVDETALAEALRAGRLAGAALDVYEREPLPPSSPLRELDNAILSPHAAWYSAASLRDLPRDATTQVIDFLQGRQIASIVNAGHARPAPAGGG